MSLRGGRQHKILNIGEIKRYRNDLSSLVPKVQNVLRRANLILPEVKGVIEGSLEMTQKLNGLLQELEMVTGSSINAARTLTLLNHINSDIEHLKKVIDVITPMAFSSNDFSLLRMVFEIQPANFPKTLDANLGGEQVRTNLQGISFYLRNNLCIGQLCFNDLSTTVEYLAGRNCFPSTPYLSMFHAKGKVLKRIPLSDGNILTLSKGQIIDMVFPRDSAVVAAHFVGEIRLFGINQSVHVTLDQKQLSFKIHGAIFNKHIASIKVKADTKHALDWRSLSFKVDGKMTNSSLLSKFLQARITNFAKHLAQKAARRVQNCEKYLLHAKQREKSAKKLVEEKTKSLNKAEREKQEKARKLESIYNAYKNMKTKLNPSLTQFAALMDNKTCDIQNCSYIVTNTCIPAVCQEKVFVNYTVPNCRKKERKLEVRELVPVQTQEMERVPIYKVVSHSTCGETSSKIVAVGAGISVVGAAVASVVPVAGAIVYGVGFVTSSFGALYDGLFGCDSYQEKVPAGIKEIKHNVTRNVIKSKTVIIEEFECGQPKIESVISGYKEPKECCKNEDGAKLEVIDPKCVSHNLDCLKKISWIKDEIKKINETLFEEFRAMSNVGKQAATAQLEANKARVNFDVAAKQLELARARLKQNEFAKESINLTRVQQREKLGLNLAGKIKNLGSNALVTVESLVFSVSMARSSSKAILPLTAYVKTFEGLNKVIQVSMDFKKENDSLALASRRIVEDLFGASFSRRRRSVEQEFPVSKKTDNASLMLEKNECLFVHEAHIFFSDIAESLLFAIKRKRDFEETMSAGIRNLETLLAVKDEPGDSSSDTWQQIGASFSDTIQTLKDAQLNNSGVISWNDTLDDVRGFLDVLSREKNFSECSGVQDCVDFFFDRLEEMYEMEYHPRAIEIKAMLQSLKKIISSALKEYHEMSTLEDMISHAKLLINKSTDDIILCGKKPEIERNSPVQFIAVLGETVNLVCEAKSTLEVEYVWMKNDQPLEETNSTILELRNVTRQSEGAYKCQASNRRGSTVSNVTIVEVHQRPNITEQPPDAQGLVGDEILSMICNSTGIPRPLTEWFFIPMNAENHKVVPVNTAAPVLRISKLTTANAGFYFCNVSNLHGTVQSRMARLDVLRFVPSVPRIAVSLKLKQCMSPPSQGHNRSHCRVNASRQSNQVGSMAFEYITRKMLERVNWPVEKVYSMHYTPFPDASISFVVNGDNISIPEGEKVEALNSFSLSRRRLGNGLKKLYFALEDESMMFKWKTLTISGDTKSFAFGFLPQWCPNGTRRHENGFLCGK